MEPPVIYQIVERFKCGKQFLYDGRFVMEPRVKYQIRERFKFTGVYLRKTISKYLIRLDIDI